MKGYSCKMGQKSIMWCIFFISWLPMNTSLFVYNACSSVVNRNLIKTPWTFFSFCGRFTYLSFSFFCVLLFIMRYSNDTVYSSIPFKKSVQNFCTVNVCFNDIAMCQFLFTLISITIKFHLFLLKNLLYFNTGIKMRK